MRPQGSAIQALEDDLYVILAVPKEADSSDIKRAFRRLSQRYHPDKHPTEAGKEEATKHFTKVKEAYEILSNEKLRKVYDDFGLEAARTAASPSNELIPYSELAESFRQDANGSNQNGSNKPRDAYFTVTNSWEPHVDATGLGVALESADSIATSDLFVFTQVGISALATAYVSQNTTLAARYTHSSQGNRFSNRRTNNSLGEVGVTARHQLDSYSFVEGAVYAPLEDGHSTNYGVKVFRALSNHMTGVLDATYEPSRGGLTTAFTANRSFSERCSGSVSWAYGASMGYAFTWRRNAYNEYVAESRTEKETDEELSPNSDNEVNETNERGFQRKVKWVMQRIAYLIEPVGWNWTLQMNGMDASFIFGFRRPVGTAFPLWNKCEAIGPGGASLKVRGRVGMLGWEVEAGGGRRYVISDTAWGTSIAVGSAGVIWRLKMARSGHKFALPVVLYSPGADAKTATVAAILTSVMVTTIQVLIITPWKAKKEKEEREAAKERRADVLENGRKEAEAAIALMQESVRQTCRKEKEVTINGRSGAGLLIEKAIYGIRSDVISLRLQNADVKGNEIELEIIDVTDAVQGLVEKSALQIISATKSTLAGFWDPSAFGDKGELVLKIWYTFRNEKHICIIEDHEVLELPLSSHRVTTWH